MNKHNSLYIIHFHCKTQTKTTNKKSSMPLPSNYKFSLIIINNHRSCLLMFACLLINIFYEFKSLIEWMICVCVCVCVWIVFNQSMNNNENNVWRKEYKPFRQSKHQCVEWFIQKHYVWMNEWMNEKEIFQVFFIIIAGRMFIE